MLEQHNNKWIVKIFEINPCMELYSWNELACRFYLKILKNVAQAKAYFDLQP